ncbi:MAG: response regulator [Anaerolineales bacterium]|nr:response regulator [Anaerolineales bacterium]
MSKHILLVDDQRDILRLLRSTLDTLKNKELVIYEAQSGEEALLVASRDQIDLLVTDYKLPGMSGVEFMRKVRARHPEVRVIFITATTDREMRDDMLNSGAFGIFDKPIPLADFLDSVERSLGFVQTIFAPELTAEAEAVQESETQHVKVSDLLVNFRQDFNADAVFLLNDRGLINARTGNLRDPSMEVSLIATLMQIHNTSLKVAKVNRQEAIESYHVFRGDAHDLLFIPVTALYALLVAGEGLAAEDRILDTVRGLVALRGQVDKSLASLGVTGQLKFKTSPLATPPVSAATVKNTEQLARTPPSPEMEALLKKALGKKAEEISTDDFWTTAAQDLARKSTNPEVLSLEEAKKMGLISDDNS